MYVVNKVSLFVLLFVYCCSWPEVKLSQFYLKNLLSDAGSRVVLYIFFCIWFWPRCNTVEPQMSGPLLSSSLDNPNLFYMVGPSQKGWPQATGPLWNSHTDLTLDKFGRFPHHSFTLRWSRVSQVSVAICQQLLP